MVKVKVCCGTSCYIMGSSELLELDLDGLNGVEVEGSTCMDLCRNSEKRPPYIKIGDRVYSQVSPEKFQKIVREYSNAL